jgi:hypothetical protein
LSKHMQNLMGENQMPNKPDAGDGKSPRLIRER